MLTLYTPSGTLKAKLEPEDSSRQTNGIQEDDVLSLSFTLYQFIEIDVNDYIDYWGTRYRCMQRTLPKQISTVEWKYDVTLYGPTSLIKRYLVINDGSVVFSLTGTPAEHLQLIIACINAAQPQGFTAYTVGTVDSTEEVTIDYNATYCNEALQQLAEQTEQEFWFQGTQVNLCKCEQGTEITLRYGQELTNLEREINTNQKFFTRLFPIGSTKNLPEEYGHDRLQLPEIGGTRMPYIEQDTETYGNIDHAEEEVFEDIYPIYVGEVCFFTRDGGFNWRIRDTYLTFNPNDSLISGQPLHILFLTGNALGLGTADDGSFPATYNPGDNTFTLTDTSSLDYDNRPQVGDIFVITNINTPQTLVTTAEKALLQRAQWFMEQSLKDISTYKAQTNHVLLRRNATALTIGHKVRLTSAQFFPSTGYMQSRITRISRYVNTPYLLDIEISETLTTSTFQSLTRKVELTYNALMASKEKEYDTRPTRLVPIWDPSMGEIPASTMYMQLNVSDEQAAVSDIYFYLPANPEERRYTFENITAYSLYLVGNGHRIVPNDSTQELLAKTLPAGETITFYYDATAAKWYIATT